MQNFVDHPYLAPDGASAIDADVAIVGRRRGSWRRFDTPASLLKEELGLTNFWLLEKLLFCRGSKRRLDILGFCPDFPSLARLLSTITSVFCQCPNERGYI